MRRIFAMLMALLLAFLGLTSCSVQSTEDYYSSVTESDSGKYAYISIDCKTILDNYDALDEKLRDEKYVPSDGIILEKTKYPIGEDDTAFSILQRATKEYKIHLEYQGADQNSLGSVYVQGINHLYEFSCGDLSGWSYSVNDELCNVSCADKILQDGDYVKWQYTCELGQDLGLEILY